MRVAASLVVPISLALAACSSAESETPVDLKPGQYAIEFVGLNGAKGTKDHCYLPEEAASFPSDPVTQFLPGPLGDRCQAHGGRKGNALSGTMTCNFEGSDTKSDLTVNWTGRMHADSFELQADGVLTDANAPGGATPNQSHVSVSAKRTGDCFS
jgi:hypothetical protein